jgi:hypothetical protein
MAEIFKGIDMHVICVSETWFKKWQTNKRISINDYFVWTEVMADEAIYIKDGLKCKVLAKSEKLLVIDCC